ncbi:MAG TPA: zinc-dependent metalloprotease [Gemmatimonadales bacterium]|nr:zinc-dependent metalloprotease [Gemmatimonadales bacterium]
MRHLRLAHSAACLLALTALISGCATGGAAPATVAVPAAQQSEAAGDGWGQHTARMERRDGFVPLWIAPDGGKLHLELPADSTRILMHVKQATGLGSNPIGIDRGATAGAQVVRFQRVGDRMLVIFENQRYRTSLSDTLHQRTIREAFPVSTVASLPILSTRNGRALVDVTDFVMRDWTNVTRTLARGQQGNYSVARDRSMLSGQYTRNFPRNTEIGVNMTYATTGNPGRTVSQIVPDGSAFTLRQHISLLPLPDDSYRPRRADSRVGYFGVSYKDFGTPLQESLDQRFIARHRLQRANPSDPNSPIVNPITYYVDPGIPEPLLSATIEGATFWSQAFDQAGLRGGFRVEVLPDSVDPMDARYNIVQWINRNERGWSIGGSLGDPRTGEILKGMARMDTHRNRTAYNLYAGLKGAQPSPGDTAFVLGRVRQVTAHEIGHTLGLAHNYIASTYGRGSLMDYPTFGVRLTNGEIDLSNAYDVGPGAFDVWAIRWGYGIFPEAAEQDSLNAIIREGLQKGWLFLSDSDARPEYASDPRTNLWDDGTNAAEYFQNRMSVRRVAIDRFGLRNLREGEPVALLQERFSPVYLMHRFAIGSLARAVGGMEYSFAMVGDGQTATRPVPAAEQRRALGMLMTALAPQELAIPDTLITLFAPRPYGYQAVEEMFGTQARPSFDELGAARTAAQMVVDAVLQRERAARLVLAASRESGALSLGETMDALLEATWRASRPSASRMAAIQRTTQRAVADALMRLAADTSAMPDVRALVDFRLASLATEASRRAGSGDEMTRAHWASIQRDINSWLTDRTLPALGATLEAPLGEPFGSDDEAWTTHDGAGYW